MSRSTGVEERQRTGLNQSLTRRVYNEKGSIRAIARRPTDRARLRALCPLKKTVKKLGTEKAYNSTMRAGRFEHIWYTDMKKSSLTLLLLSEPTAVRLTTCCWQCRAKLRALS